MKKTNWGEWFRAAGIRAIKTIAQTAVSMLTGELVGIMETDWLAIASVSAMAGIVSLLTSVAGLPEVPKAAEGTEEE